MDKDAQLLQELMRENGGRERTFVESMILPLLRSRYLVAAITVFGGFFGIFYGLTLPNDFRSTGKILVQLGARERVTLENAGASAGAAMQVAFEELQNELQILTVPSVYRSVADAVGPERILAPYDPLVVYPRSASWLTRIQHRFQSWWFGRKGQTVEGASGETKLEIAARVLEIATAIRPEAASQVISVSYGTHDPKVAHDVVAAFLVQFNQAHQNVFSTDPKLEFYERTFREASDESEAADMALNDYKAECSLYDLPTQRTILATSFEQCAQEIESAKHRLAGLEAELKEYRSRLEKYPETITEQLPLTEGANPEWTSLDQTLTELRIARGELRAQYSEDSPMIRNKDEFIKNLEERLRTIKPLIVTGGGEREVVNPARVRIQQKIDDLQAEQAHLTASLQEKQETLIATDRKLQRLQECEPMLALLAYDSEAKRAVVKQMYPGLHDLRTKKSLDTLNETNLRTIQPANLPTRKSGPNRMKFVMAFTFLGFAFGASVAFLRNLANRTVRRPEDIEAKLGTKVLAVIAESRPWQRAARS
ncbi:MAG: hypothetical protein L0Z55_00485 [Planctomycetes bacterium]|nr:hypothetical protein [Planctomycetota bacterium]